MSLLPVVKTAIKSGMVRATKQWRLTTLVYLVQLILVLILSLQVFQVLEASIGNSLQINALGKGYNHTALTDFFKVHGASFTPLLGQLRWFLLLWIVFGSFLQGGLLCGSTHKERLSVPGFFADCARYFLTFLSINLAGLVLALLCGAVLVGGVLSRFESLIEHMESEKGFLVLLAVSVFIWFFIVLVIYALVLLTKLAIVSAGMTVKRAGLYAWSKFKTDTGTYLCIAFLAALMVLLFWVIFQWLAGPDYWSKPPILFILTLVQQAFVWLRIWLRQVVYGAYHSVLGK